MKKGDAKSGMRVITPDGAGVVTGYCAGQCWPASHIAIRLDKAVGGSGWAGARHNWCYAAKLVQPEAK